MFKKRKKSKIRRCKDPYELKLDYTKVSLRKSRMKDLF